MRWDESADSPAIVGEVTPDEPLAATVEGVTVLMPAGRPIRVLQSFRHDPAGLELLLASAGLRGVVACVSPSGEEGVAVAVA